MRNRGLRINEQPDPLDIWQRPHHQDSPMPPVVQQSSTPILPHPFGSSTLAAQTAAERTPLLGGSKKS